MRFVWALFFALLHCVSTAQTTMAITNIADLATAVYRDARDGVPFSLSGQVSTVRGRDNAILGLQDDTGAAIIHLLRSKTNIRLSPGDRVQINGCTKREREGCIVAFGERARVIGNDQPPKPVNVDITDIFSGNCDCRVVRISGIVKDSFRDDIDPDWTIIVLGTENGNLYLALSSPGEPRSTIDLTGSTISAIGLCCPIEPGRRRLIRRLINIASTDDIAILKQPDKSSFSAPLLKSTFKLRADEIPTLGRSRVIGRVLATWHGDSMIIQSQDDEIIGITLRDGPLPRWNETIEAEGIPTTDLFRANLTRAIWRPSHAPAPPLIEKPVQTAAAGLSVNDHGHQVFDTTYHGKLVSLTGRVIALPAEGYGDGVLMLEDEPQTFAVDISTIRPYTSLPEVGSLITATGICIFETEPWSPNAMFPRVNGFRIIVRTPDDLMLRSAPPWWTPKRLLIMLFSLAVILLGIIIWNISLRVLVERRSRELLREQIARVGADMKVAERTRLAVDLHDSVAQNLSGVSLRIDAVCKTIRSNPDKAEQILHAASDILLSSRQELRNCLWDLRSHALEIPDMNEAIRLTLKPHVENVEVEVRFNVPRSRISDNTTHTVLCVIRELTVNAIRHGQAKHVRIAGALSASELKFSVRDDGCGFDPLNAQGPAQGHFGIQGIRDRLRKHDGSLDIESRPGLGTTAIVTLS